LMPSVKGQKSLCSFYSAKVLVHLYYLTFEPDVTLDLDTANPRLIVSEAGKQVRHVDTWQSVTDNPKRFDPSVFVLAREGFTTGRHYWEVEVGEKTDWILGVARESVDRKGDVNLSPYDGFWTLCLLKEETFEYWALTDPDVHLPLRVNPWTVGVFLNYDEGQVSFYNAKTRTHLYTFKESFNEKLYPFFSMINTHNTVALTKVTVENDTKIISNN
uniref:B30.2/SPRY domain-containing protein n=1 Tax=Erpetoichthys calabaricus TaxID=27687 RepID=A0A8C4T7A5_ERPCA